MISLKTIKLSLKNYFFKLIADKVRTPTSDTLKGMLNYSNHFHAQFNIFESNIVADCNDELSA